MKVTLVSHTDDPIGTALKVWEAAKSDSDMPTDDLMYSLESQGLHSQGRAGLALFQRIIDQQIPVSQNIVFNFILDDVPIAWREQAVRHRVGVKYGDNFAVDIIPEADFSFWSQSMRIQSMGEFSDRQLYFTPSSITDNAEAHEEYVLTMNSIQAGYNRLVALGVPLEDARNVIPLGATHRISMTINLQSLQHIIGERGCWILQASLWHPIIHGIVDELTAKVHPIFRRLVAPPCVKAGTFKGCVFHEENRRRKDGEDPLPVCPLWVTEQMGEVASKQGMSLSGTAASLTPAQTAAVNAKIPEFAALWDQPQLAATWEWANVPAV